MKSRLEEAYSTASDGSEASPDVKVSGVTILVVELSTVTQIGLLPAKIKIRNLANNKSIVLTEGFVGNCGGYNIPLIFRGRIKVPEDYDYIIEGTVKNESGEDVKTNLTVIYEVA